MLAWSSMWYAHDMISDWCMDIGSYNGSTNIGLKWTQSFLNDTHPTAISVECVNDLTSLAPSSECQLDGTSQTTPLIVATCISAGTCASLTLSRFQLLPSTLMTSNSSACGTFHNVSVIINDVTAEGSHTSQCWQLVTSLLTIVNSTFMNFGTRDGDPIHPCLVSQSWLLLHKWIGDGSVIHAISSSIINISLSTFTGNVGDRGGALYLDSSHLVMSGTSLSYNQANSSGIYGFSSHTQID